MEAGIYVVLHKDASGRINAASVAEVPEGVLTSTGNGIVGHRLSLVGNRKLDYALHMVAVCQARSDARGGAHYRKKMALRASPVRRL